MAEKKRKPVRVVTKPFITGSITDENTLRNALKFFGILLLVVVMSFIACMMSGFGGSVLRTIVNLAIIILSLFIMFNKGTDKGAEDVSRGEILYQRREKEEEMTDNERKLSYHPFKGYFNGLLGTVPFLIPALILAFTAQKQVTTIGTLPSWMNTMARRSEIGDALLTYTQPAPVQVTDILRAVVRFLVMPFVSIAGSENKDLLLTVERLSPVLLLLPCIAYGTGYTRGPAVRTRVHTSIAENIRIRKRRENKAKQASKAAGAKHEPEQLN